MSAAWTCSTCAVSVRYLPGFAPSGELPNGWAPRGDELRCLGCRWRELTSEAEAEGLGRKETARRLAAFEVGRAPADSNKRIAGRLRRTVSAVSAAVSPSLVAEVRTELIASGEVESQRRPPRPPAAQPAPALVRAPCRPGSLTPAPPRPSYAERYPAVAAELRRDPRRSNPAVADAADLNGPSFEARRHLVRSVRIEMERTGVIERWRSGGGAPTHRSKATA
jgi:hypothetical protein